MKSVLIFIAGFITAILLIVGGGYMAMKYYENMTEEYQSEWLPDFDARLYESTTKLAVAKTEYERWIAISDVSIWNVDNGSLEKAEQLANMALETAKKYQDDWNYGNAIHKGHLALGRVAIRHDNIEEAKKQLLLSGKTPGSPQLDSFGPNMILAKELLEKGERETVIRYLDLCSAFWESPFSKLAKWKDQIANGDMPDFGANLIY